jgi:hypothetical protein
MQLTKQQLIEAHKQGLNVLTKEGTAKIIDTLNNIYAIEYYNKGLVVWHTFEQLQSIIETIEQPKPKYNGRAVKCDTVEQANWLYKKEYSCSKNIHNSKPFELICIYLTHQGWDYEKEAIKNNYEIISFSQYCTENSIVEPKYIQGFEVKDGYNEIVSCSNDNVNFRIDILKIVYSDNCEFPFTCVNGSYRYVRYPHKEEINEIKFSN